MLTAMFGADAISRQDGAIQIRVTPDHSGDVNTKLVGAGITVSELRPFEKSLEEVFFQLTGETQGS
jgi:ABC-2 type transport system ATP-binding protein